MIAYTTHLTQIFISNGSRNLFDFNIYNDPLKYKNYGIDDSLVEKKGIDLFDFVLVLKNDPIKNFLGLIARITFAKSKQKLYL